MFQNIFYCDKYYIYDECPDEDAYYGFLDLICIDGTKISTRVSSNIPLETYEFNRYIYGTFEERFAKVSQSQKDLGIESCCFVGKFIEGEHSWIFLENDIMRIRINGLWAEYPNQILPISIKHLEQKGIKLGDIGEIQYSSTHYNLDECGGYGWYAQKQPHNNFLFGSFSVFSSSYTPEPLTIPLTKKWYTTSDDVLKKLKELHFGGMR